MYCWTSIIKNRHEREFDNVEEKVQKKIKSLNLRFKKITINYLN